MCNYTVIDFRGRTQEEIDRFKKEYSGKSLCGLFTRSQVSNTKAALCEPAPSFYRSDIFKRVRLIIVICFAGFLFSCGGNKEDTVSHEDNFWTRVTGTYEEPEHFLAGVIAPHITDTIPGDAARDTSGL